MEDICKVEQQLDYNDIPVYYCKDCLSLKIMGKEGEDMDYCDDCGSTEIETCHIEEWQKLYENKYKVKF